MPTLPNATRTTATYAFQILAFQAPMTICAPALELDRQNYVRQLRIVSLAGRLETFLFQVFEADVIRKCGIYGDVIYIGTTPNIPGRPDLARPADALGAVWRAMTGFTRQQLPQPDWDSMPAIELPRGKGLNLGQAGIQMARMMDRICGVPTA